MKGEIFRLMPMEIIKVEGVELNNPITQDIEHDKTDNEEDYLVNTIGAFGLWQAVVSVTVFTTRGISLWNILSLFFLTPITEYICVEFSGNATTEVYNSTCYDNCVKYKYSSVIGRSIIEDFGLICHNAWQANFIQTIMMIGIMIGAWLFGWISDRYGRRTALLLATFLNAFFMITLPASPTYMVFNFIRFMIGVASGGTMTIGVVQTMEMIGKQQREIAAACVIIPDGLAQASLAGFANLTSNWQCYTLSYGVVTCFIFILILFIPESPRWLVSHGKFDEAIKVINRAATRNKLDTSNIKAKIMNAIEEINLKGHENVKTSYLEFFKSKSLFIKTSAIFILWVTMGVCYYGINQSIIGTNLYLVVLITGLIQVPICPLSIAVNRRLRRRISIIGTTSCTAIATLITIFVPDGYMFRTMLSVLGFIFSNISFSIAYIYVSELYPTPLRNMSYGLASCGAKIGAMVSPFIAKLSSAWLASLIFCTVAFVGTLCCLSFPETKGQNLKDTIEE